MLYAIAELQRSLTYHQKQLEENIQNIERKQESIDLLLTANEKHVEIIFEIKEAMKKLQKGIGGQTENPEENVCTK